MEHVLDGVHAASWETCVDPVTCNLTQELNLDEGYFSIRASIVCLVVRLSLISAYPHAALKLENHNVFPRSWRIRHLNYLSLCSTSVLIPLHTP
jgi:hypothetical protein